jgi:intracellular sulfur oxidation DsrE/DsrF family protein
MKIQYKLPYIFFLALFLIQLTLSFGQDNEPTTGPVFNNIGAVYSIDSLDFLPDTSQHLKAIFDVDKRQTDPSEINSIISSLHRYYNMHVRYGVPKDKIHLAVVLHGYSTKDALLPSVYKEKFNVDNPNKNLIKSLSDIGVEVFICGQSMSYNGYSKEDLLPEVKVALSAMTVLTVYQMNNYALIKF